MAMLGQGARPVASDYSPMADSAWKLASSNANAFGGLVDAIKDKNDEQKQYKDVLKQSTVLAEAFKTLNPEAAAMLDPVLAEMKDEENPLSARAAIGANIGELINLDRQTKNDAFTRSMQLEGLLIDQQDAANRSGAAGRDARQFDFNMGQTEKTLAQNEEVQSFVAPALLEQAIGMARGIEESGGRPPISADILQQALQTGTPEANIRLAETFQGLLPQSKEPVIREIDVTIDGQPSRLPVTYNHGTGKFEPVEIGGQSGGGNLQELLPAPLAPYAATFEAAGAKYGIDPKFLAAVSMHETGGGTSSAFRNKANAMGISNASGPTSQASVEASIEKMARELAKPGGYYDGKNTVGDIGKTYAPIGAGNDPRGLNKNWASGVGQYYAQLGGDPKASVRITPGAVKGGAAAKTAAELQKEQLEIQKLQGEVAGKQADADKQGDMKAVAVASAQETLADIDRLMGTKADKSDRHKGFQEAVGAGFYRGVGAIPGVPDDWTPAGSDKAGAISIINKVKASAFLNSIQQLRGLGALSDAEGKKLEAAAANLDPNQGEKDFEKSIAQFREYIQTAIARLGGAGAAAPKVKDASYYSGALGGSGQ